MIDLLIVGGYLTFMLGVGWRARKASADAYWVADRQYGTGPVAASLVATIFGASSTVGIIGLGYSRGLTGAWWALVGGLALVPFAFFLASRVRTLEVYTLPDILRKAYGKRVEMAGGVVIAIAWCGVVAAQIVAGAHLVGGVFSLPFRLALSVVAVVFVLYTYGGGLLAVVWTDVVCYFVLMAAVVIGFPLALRHAGGIAGLHQALPPDRFDLGQLGVIEPLAWVALCFYSYGTDQAYVQRVFAAKKVDAARFAYLFTGLNYVVFGGAVAVLGMSAAALLPDLAHHDEALPALIMYIFPPGVRGLFLTGVVAATMSTSSSFLAAGSSLFAKDIYEPVLARGSSEKHLLLSLIHI